MKRFEASLIYLPESNTTVIRKLKEQGKKLGLLSNADGTEIKAWSKSPIASYFNEVVFLL